MKAIRDFAALFATSLYNTGFSEPVKESGLSKVETRDNALSALVWLRGYAAAMVEANRAVAAMGNPSAPKQEKICAALERAFMFLEKALMPDATEESIADLCASLEKQLIEVCA